MADQTSGRDSPPEGNPPEDRRNAYSRPQIVSREPLEAIAATCTGTGKKATAGRNGCVSTKS